MSDSIPLVTLQIDDQEVQVPRGTNIIEAALQVQTEIPFYCYHRHLSVAGNCRMCQVELEGAPKLTIACNTGAQEGMKIRTHKTSKKVRDAQRATLEFLLINHPIDCTVCDQAGHCKLQDYYFEYNTRASRFIEDKVRKVKAEDIGAEIKYDGERCILCTRCVRFCDEVTGTSELSVLNRGDRSVIAANSDRPLNNPFSGTTVDLCPVGALTHTRWRFNSRIWYAGVVDSICLGCSTGCNVKVAVQDDTIVQVKGRLNSDVNKEWMCDVGRYGFNRFQPNSRLSTPLLRDGDYLTESTFKDALSTVAQTFQKSIESDGKHTAVLLSPHLSLEDQWVAFNFAEKVFGISADSENIAMQHRSRSLSEVEEILISPDYAPNARGAQLLGYLSPDTAPGDQWRSLYEARYNHLLNKIRSGVIKQLILVGDYAISNSDLDESTIKALLLVPASLAISPRAPVEGEAAEEEEPLGAHQLCRAIIPSVSVYEKSGVFVNSDLRLQKSARLISPPIGVMPEWWILNKVATSFGQSLLPPSITNERELFLAMVKSVALFQGLTLARIGDLGVPAQELPVGSGISEDSPSENSGVSA